MISLPIAIAAGVVAFHYVPKPLPEISREELIAQAQAGYVTEVVITDGVVVTGVSTMRGAFRVMLGKDDKGIADELSRLGVTVTYESEPLGLI